MRHRRHRSGSANVGLAALFCLAGFASAEAAEIRVRSAGECAERGDIAEQVDALLGRPVAAVEGLSFDVDIAELPGGRWRLRLATTATGEGTTRSREIEGRGCAELADAAAVAIAMSIQSSDAPERSRVAAPRVPDEPGALPATTVGPGVAETPRGLEVPLVLAALGDAGALPTFGLGLALGASLAWHRVRLIGEAALLFSPEVRVADGSGGRFRLFTGTVLACLDHHLWRSGLLGCAGVEAGVFQGEGLGVSRPRLQNVPWEAARLELGLTRRLNAAVSLVLRAGVAVPWARPTFTINNDMYALHRAAPVTARLTFGALFDLF